jgi:hydroxymethylpyrimidine pyrophosphatase-like HAD family hydrolase
MNPSDDTGATGSASPATLRPLAAMPREVARAVHTVLTDIDDTLSSEGRLTAAAYTALEQLHEAGLRVVPVTGRPAGWCDHVARFWPVDAVVGENGAFYMWRERGGGGHAGGVDGAGGVIGVSAAGGRLCARHWLDETGRAASTAKLAAVRARILAEVPGCAVASDQFCRLYDLAIDFCEDVPPLPPEAIDRIVALMRESGMTAKVSSIHVNGWFGEWDKLAMTRRLMAERFGIDIDDAAEREHIVFVGDSPNDEPMFAFFPHAVGVANVLAARSRMSSLPAWVTTSPAGAGFVELARHLLAARA